MSFVLVHASTVSALNRGFNCSSARSCRSSGRTARVGRDEDEHRGQVGSDHPDALRAPADAKSTGIGRGLLVDRVGGHDRVREVVPAVGRQRTGEVGSAQERLDVERLADHSRRAREDVGGALRSSSGGGRDDDRLARRHPPLAGRCIRLAAVDVRTVRGRPAASRAGCRCTGAAATRFVVNKPATVVPDLATSSRGRGWPTRLRPAADPGGLEPSRVRHAHGYTASVGRRGGLVQAEQRG